MGSSSQLPPGDCDCCTDLSKSTNNRNNISNSFSMCHGHGHSHSTNLQKVHSLDSSVEIPHLPPLVVDLTEVQSNDNVSDTVLQPEGSTVSAWKSYGGLLFALQSSLVFSITALLVKSLKNYDPVNIALWRFQGAVWPSLGILIVRSCRNVRSKSKSFEVGDNGEKGRGQQEALPLSKLKMFIFLMMRSILSCNALLLHFYSLKYLEIGDALVISSSTPVFVTLFAHYFLEERTGIVPIVTAITTILGVVIITKPPHLTGEESFNTETLLGTGLALGCMLLATVSLIVLRFLRTAHYALVTFAFGSWGTLETFIVSFLLGYLSLPQEKEDWILAVTLAMLTFLGQIAIILALKCEQAGPVSLMRTSDVVFAFLWQIVFLKSIPDIYSIIGATIVVSGVLVTTFRKWLSTQSEVNKMRQLFSFFLK